MSGFEVVGVVLGAIPLVISALERYKADKGVVATFIKYHGLLDKLIYRLNRQRKLFYLDILDLLRESGVPEAVNQPNLPEEECLRVLRDARTGLELPRYLEGEYKDFLEILGRYEACLRSIASKLRLQGASAVNLEDLLVTNPSHSTGLNFEGRMSFTIRRGALRELVQDLSDERLSLKDISQAARTYQRFLARDPSREARQIASTFSQVRERARSLFAAMCHVCTCCEVHTVLMQLKNRLPQQHERAMETQMQTTMFNPLFPDDQSLQEATVMAYPVNQNMPLTSNIVSPNQSPESLNIPTITLTPFSATQYTQAMVIPLDICHITETARTSGNVVQLELALHNLSTVRAPSGRCRRLSVAKSLEQVLSECDMLPKARTILGPVEEDILKIVSPEVGRTLVEPFVEQTIGPTSLSHPPDLPDPKTAILELAILLLEIWNQKALETWTVVSDIEDFESLDMRLILAIRWVRATSGRMLRCHLDAVEYCLGIYAGRLRQWDDEEFLKQYCENVIKPLQESCEAWVT